MNLNKYKNYKTVCITGHRPSRFSFGYDESDARCIKIKKVIKQQVILLIKKGYYYFISGMALGVDQWFVEILLELKFIYPQIVIEGIIPCKNHSNKWPQEAKNKYNDMLSKIDIIHYSGITEYNSKSMIARDKCMVNKSDTIIAVCLDINSGTKKTYDYAKNIGRNLIKINPKTLNVEYKKGTNFEKILECSSLGDSNYSAMFAKVKVFDKYDTIERMYQLSKRINGVCPKKIKEIKGKMPTSFVVGNKEFDIKYLTAWYNLLWCKYLDSNKELVYYAQMYDRFNDTFKGKCINCQADIIKRYIKDGRENIIKECIEFISLLKK